MQQLLALVRIISFGQAHDIRVDRLIKLLLNEFGRWFHRERPLLISEFEVDDGSRCLTRRRVLVRYRRGLWLDR